MRTLSISSKGKVNTDSEEGDTNNIDTSAWLQITQLEADVRSIMIAMKTNKDYYLSYNNRRKLRQWLELYQRANEYIR